MKKVAVVLMLLVAITATAQRGDHHSRNGMKGFNPEQIATLQTKKAILALDLTEVQQGQMKALMLENAKMRKTKMKAHKTQKENGEIKKLSAEERFTRANDHLDYQIAQKAKLKTFLSEEQLAKWEKMQHKKGRHHMKKGEKKKCNHNKPEKK